MKLELTEAEWAELRGDVGCCAQIRYVRNLLIYASVAPALDPAFVSELQEALGNAYVGIHAVPTEAMAKVCRAAGFDASVGKRIRVQKETFQP